MTALEKRLREIRDTVNQVFIGQPSEARHRIISACVMADAQYKTAQRIDELTQLLLQLAKDEINKH